MSNEKAQTEKAGIMAIDEITLRGLIRAAQFLEQHGITGSNGELWDDECREALAHVRRIGLCPPAPVTRNRREGRPEIDCATNAAEQTCERSASSQLHERLQGGLIEAAISALKGGDFAGAVALVNAHLALRAAS